MESLEETSVFLNPKDYKKLKKESKNVEVVDSDMLSAICMALRKSAESKAKKDWENKQSPIEDRRDC